MPKTPVPIFMHLSFNSFEDETHLIHSYYQYLMYLSIPLRMKLRESPTAAAPPGSSTFNSFEDETYYS